MKKQLSVSVLVGALGFAAGCGSDGATAAPSFVSAEGLICEPSGFPFVTLAGANSDACAGSARLRFGTRIDCER